MAETQVWQQLVTPEQATERFNDGLFTFNEVMDVFDFHYGEIKLTYKTLYKRFREYYSAFDAYVEVPHTVLIEIAYSNQKRKCMLLILGEVI